MLRERNPPEFRLQENTLKNPYQVLEARLLTSIPRGNSTRPVSAGIGRGRFREWGPTSLIC